LFDFGDGRVRHNEKIATTLSSVLFALLGQPQGEPVSLATRNLLRNLAMQVPSGQRVAKAMQLPQLAPERPRRPRTVPPAHANAALVLRAARGAGSGGR
jgi:hypothetical protein